MKKEEFPRRQTALRGTDDERASKTVLEMSREGNKRIRSRRNEGIGNIYGGIMGNELLEVKNLFPDGVRYNFDRYLQDGIPEQYNIEIANGINELGFRECINEELELEQLNKELAKPGVFETNIVEHKSKYSGCVSKKNIYNLESDPMDDSIFTKTFEKASKVERKFLTSDRESILGEVDKSLELLKLLGLPIKKGNAFLKEMLTGYVVEDEELNDDMIFRITQLLGLITKISDSKDHIEIILKYRLTVREVRSFLLTFYRTKMIESVFKKDIYMIENELMDKKKPGNDQSIGSRKTLDLFKLKQKRLKDRDSRVGKIKKIKFKDGVTLVVDPISKPLVTKDEEAKIPKRKGDKLSETRANKRKQ